MSDFGCGQHTNIPYFAMLSRPSVWANKRVVKRTRTLSAFTTILAEFSFLIWLDSMHSFVPYIFHHRSSDRIHS